jgi:hypothetical protein
MDPGIARTTRTVLGPNSGVRVWIDRWGYRESSPALDRLQ